MSLDLFCNTSFQSSMVLKVVEETIQTDKSLVKWLLMSIKSYGLDAKEQQIQHSTYLV